MVGPHVSLNSYYATVVWILKGKKFPQITRLQLPVTIMGHLSRGLFKHLKLALQECCTFSVLHRNY